MPNEMQFHGILAVGRTKADAVNNYRLLAMNKGATVQVDSGHSIAFVAQANNADGMFNPMSGNMDLETDDSYIKQLDFNSNSSDQHEVNHLVCTSGCGAHVVFDSDTLVKYCPHCTSSLSEDDSDEGEEDMDDMPADFDDEEDAENEEGTESNPAPESDDLVGDTSVDQSESADDADDTADDESDDTEGTDDATDADQQTDDADVSEDDTDEDAGTDPDEDAADAADSDEAVDEAADATPSNTADADDEDDSMPDLTDDDGSIVISSDGHDDGKIMVAATSLAEASELYSKHVDQTSVSSDGGKVEVTYMVCTSSDCGAHILATGDIESCPACLSSVEEPDGDEDCDDEDSNTLGITTDDGGILNEDTEEMDALDDVPEEAESDSSQIDVSYSSSVAGQARWTVYVQGAPVAMASKSSAGKNADIFDTPSFGHALLATAKAAGLRKALSELGFSGIKRKVSVSKAVRKMVDGQVKDAQVALASDQQQFKDRFMAALATAAVGLNRGFYGTKKNPIKASMWSALSSAGIRNPEALIDTAFKNHGDAYHKTLFALASELVSKPAEVQESLSKSIHEMSFMEATSSAADDSIEGRLETFGVSVSSEPVVSKQDHVDATGSLGRQHISAAVATLGRKGR